jgi:hypothetical protein
MLSLQYAFNAANNGWDPITVSASPSSQPTAQSVFARVYGATSPFVDISAQTQVSAGWLGETTFPISGPNPNDPNGLFTIAVAHAKNAALTDVVPGRMVDETAATLTATADASIRGASLNYVFDGTNFIRALGASAAVLATLSPAGAQLSQGPGQWAINHTPAANTQATISRAAAAGQRHVCKSITATLIGLAASVETTVLVNLRDGTTGAGTILWSARLLVIGTAGSQGGIALSGLDIVGSVNTAMTLEFAAAGGANTLETVALTGVTA